MTTDIKCQYAYPISGSGVIKDRLGCDHPNLRDVIKVCKECDGDICESKKCN